MSLALLDSAEHFMNEMRYYVSIHSRPIRRLTEAADGEGACGLPLPGGRGYGKGFHRLRCLVNSVFPPEGGGFKPQRNF